MNYENRKEEKNTLICVTIKRKVKLVFILIIVFIILLSSSSTLLASVADDAIILIKNANSDEELTPLTEQTDLAENNVDTNVDEENNSTEDRTTQEDSKEREIQYTEEYLKWLNSSEEEKKAYGDVIPTKEFVPFNEDKEPYKEQGSEEKTEESQNNNSDSQNSTIVRKDKTDVIESGSGSLPSFYRLNNYYDITVENQGRTGWCWAYSNLKALQTHLQVKGYYNPINNTNTRVKEDFSEWHFVYKTVNGNYQYEGSFNDFRKYVGNYDFNNRVDLIPQPRGPVYEDQITQNITDLFRVYDTIYLSGDDLTHTNNLTPAYKVTKTVRYSNISKIYNSGNVRYFSGNQELSYGQIQEFRNSIKNHIQKYGGIYACTYNPSDSRYINKGTSAIYGEDNNISHSVTIIGWDDNYSRYNFNEWNRPQNDGAYIVLDSWETGEGDYGYRYISYDDSIIEQELFGILEVQRYDQIPDYKVTYKRKDANEEEVNITSSQRLRLEGVPDGTGLYNNGWRAEAKLSEDIQFGKIYTTETKLYKVYNTTANNERVAFYDDFMNNKQIAAINVDLDPPKFKVIAEATNNAWKPQEIDSNTPWTNGNIILRIKAKNVAELGDKPYTFDGDNWTNTDYKLFKDKTQVIWIGVRDKKGNVSKKIFGILIDTNRPTITKIWGNPGSYTNKDLKIGVAAKDESGESGINAYRFNNGEWQTSNTYEVKKQMKQLKIEVRDKARKYKYRNNIVKISR